MIRPALSSPPATMETSARANPSTSRPQPGQPRGAEQKAKNLPCDMCGYQFTIGDFMNAFAIVCFRGEDSVYGKKRVRWPHRKRAGCVCPECGHHQTLITDISRHCLEMA